MTKIRNLKLATKFVFREEGGVYKKMTTNKAKCIFGRSDLVGTEVGIDPDTQVFVIPDTPRPDVQEVPVGKEMIKVRFVDGDEELIHERIVPIGIATILSAAEIIAVRTAPRKRQELFTIGDIGLDLEKRELHMEVIHREPVAKKEDNENRRTPGKTRRNARFQ